MVLGVVRDGQLIRAHDPRCRSLLPGDRVMRLLHVGLAPEQPTDGPAPA